ncbi:MAG: hypothetical protein HOD60_14995 [Candidatus Nitrosopelagicus sp.]|jgi:hypothetical protein|nr:hypothetical protein [Candidatus Nitrosopelagicus sp.]
MGFKTKKDGTVYNDDKKEHGQSGSSPGNNDGSNMVSRNSIRQSDMITQTTFNAVVVDVDDIVPLLEDQGLSNQEAEEKAQKLVESDYFRTKLTDLFLMSFHEDLETAIEEYGDKVF